MRKLLLLTTLLLVCHAGKRSHNIDAELMDDIVKAEREVSSHPKKVNRRGIPGRRLENEVRDADFAKPNYESQELSTVTFAPSSAEDTRPSLDSSEVAVGMQKKYRSSEEMGAPMAGKGSTTERPPLYELPPPRKGFYFQHYPWWLLPRQYRLRSKDFGYVYPPQYQRAKYYWPGRLPSYYDPYAIYESTKRAREHYYGGAGGYGGASGGGQGFGGGGIETDNLDSGEVELSKKANPLDDLSLETLQKIDKLGADGLVDEEETDDFAVAVAKSKRDRAPVARALRSRAV
ncbi:unnamed protein product, partial [Mesorhabditis spiculigera]